MSKKGGMAAFLAAQRAKGKQEMVVAPTEVPVPGRTLDPEDEDLPQFDEAAYSEMTQIGEGKFGTVYSAKDKDGNKVAIKTLRYKGKQMEKDVRREFALQQKCAHASVCEVKELSCDDSSLHLVMEMVDGSELFECLDKIDNDNRENVCRRIIKQIIEALAHCHSQNVAHLDMKLQNVMLTTSDVNTADAKLVDFGLSREFGENKPILKKMLGTPMLAAPEMFDQREYTCEADMWSVGCVLYQLLTGREAFPEKNRIKLMELVVNEKYEMTEDPWPSISDDAKGLVKGLLVKDQSARLTAEDALKHAWFSE